MSMSLRKDHELITGFLDGKRGQDVKKSTTARRSRERRLPMTRYTLVLGWFSVIHLARLYP